MQKKNTFIQSYLWYLVGFIIVLLPFHAFLTAWFASNFGFFDSIRLWKEWLLLILAVVLLSVLITDKSARNKVKGEPVLKYAAVALFVLTHYFMYGLASRNVSFNAAAYGAVINGRFLLFMLCVFTLTKLTGIPKNWAHYILIPAGIVVGYGIIQFLILPKDFLKHFGYGPDTLPAFQTIDSHPSYPRIQSTLRGPNPLGAYLVPVLILIFERIWHVTKRRGWWIAFGLVTLVAMFGSYSRSAYIGVIGGTWFFIFWSLKEKRHQRQWLQITAVAAVVFLGLFFALRNNDTFQNVVFHSNENSKSPQSSNEKRASYMEEGLKEIYKAPLGSGIGSAGPASLRNENGEGKIAENYFIQIGQEMGIVGIAVYVATLVAIIVSLWDRRHDPLPRVALAGLFGLIFVNLVSHAWADDTLAYIFFGIVGLALATKKSTKSEKKVYT